MFLLQILQLGWVQLQRSSAWRGYASGVSVASSLAQRGSAAGVIKFVPSRKVRFYKSQNLLSAPTLSILSAPVTLTVL